MPNSAETIERLARESERLQMQLERLQAMVSKATSLDELREQAKALTGKA